VDPTTDPTRRRVPPTESIPRGSAEAASALVLVPAMLLVLLCLGGVAVDLTIVHGAHRGAHRIVSAAADDAAAMIDTDLLQESGELRVDPELARRVALAQLDAMVLPGTVVGSPVVTVSAAGDVVTIAVDLDIDHVMLRAVPGHPDHQQIHVAASARLNR